MITWCLAAVTLLALLTLTKKGEDFSRLWLFYWWAGVIFALIINKAIIYSLAAYIRSKGKNTKAVIIVGCPKLSQKIQRQINQASWSGFEIRKTLNINDLSTPESIEQLIGNQQAEIWLALPISEGKKIQELLIRLRNHTQNIRLIPSIADLRLLNHKISEVAGLQTIDLSVSPLYGANAAIKRIFDIIFSLCVLIFISPIMLAISMAVKITSPGPVIFKQDRNGINGKSISVYKFRSMYQHNEATDQITQAKKNDSRITPIGAFLRKSSLDELPQFVNVLQGKMSVVGPRPHAIAHNEEYKGIVDSYMRRHKVKPGITGWAQVCGFRGETDTLEKMEKRVDLDLFYIDNWSIWFDIKIVVMTVVKGFFSKNAY